MDDSKVIGQAEKEIFEKLIREINESLDNPSDPTDNQDKMMDSYLINSKRSLEMFLEKIKTEEVTYEEASDQLTSILSAGKMIIDATLKKLSCTH